MDDNTFEMCNATSDRNGVPYNERLKRIRESSGKSLEELATALGWSLRQYLEYEDFADELTMVTSLKDLSLMGSALGVPTRRFFEDETQEERPVSVQELCAKINEHLKTAKMSLAEFEDKVGFEINSIFEDVTTLLEWNVDCLRFVCAEIEVNWLLALP